jgi:uncharacterized protein
MTLQDRHLQPFILKDLKEKMVFISGPRQVGKTTLASKLLSRDFQKMAFFNWDNRQDRKAILNGEWPGNSELVVFDEIHKYRKWKTLVKEHYDKFKDTIKFIVLGSARLDTHRKGGDSLQ